MICQHISSQPLPPTLMLFLCLDRLLSNTPQDVEIMHTGVLYILQKRDYTSHTPQKMLFPLVSHSIRGGLWSPLWKDAPSVRCPSGVLGGTPAHMAQAMPLI